MLFEMSSETLRMLMQTEVLIQKSLGHELDFTSDNLISDFFELCALCQDRRIALQADQIWARLIKENAGFDRSKFLNQYRARMQSAVQRREGLAA